MNRFDIYLYGMILKTNAFLLAGDYPEPEGYGEIKEKFCLPGGETGTCATVLSSLGCAVQMDGNHMGANTYPLICDFYAEKAVDLSPLTFDAQYEGLEDYVLIDAHGRTPLGTFNHFFTCGQKRWNRPSPEGIRGARVVGLDPFFQEESLEVARLCRDFATPFVTIDCPYDGELNALASINAVSGEYVRGQYPDIPLEELHRRYTEHTGGLVIFTQGAREVLYGRKGEAIKRFPAYKVEAVSTLGAGDTFKAGCVYALLNGMSDEDTVSFASACAAVACTRFPLPLHPPTLGAIQELMQTTK